MTIHINYVTNEITAEGAPLVMAGSVTGNAGTATQLETARAINGVAFDGAADITVKDQSARVFAYFMRG